MKEYSVQQQKAISDYRAKNNLGFVISDEEVVSIMQKEMKKTGSVYAGFESLAADKNNLADKKQNVFGAGFTKDNSVGVTIERTTQEIPQVSPLPEQAEAIDFLKNITGEAKEIVDERDKEAGVLSSVVNTWQEIFNEELAKSTIKKELKNTQTDIELLEAAANGKCVNTNYFTGETSSTSFEDMFKKRRGVEFDKEAVSDCAQKAESFARIKTATEMIKITKQELSAATAGDVKSQMNPEKSSHAIVKAFNLSGVTKVKDMNAVLKNIEEKYKDNPDIQKYGGNLRLEKNSKGQPIVMRTTSAGKDVPATNEELQIIAKEMGMSLDRAYANALGAEIPENANAEQLSQLTQQTFDKYQKEYEDSFAKAYGKKDLKILADRYVTAQQQGVANIEAGLNIASMALMIVPGGAAAASGWLLKGSVALKGAAAGTKFAEGLNFVNKAKTIVKAAQGLQRVQQIASPIVMANMTLRPTELVEQLSSENGMSAEEWEEWGKGVLQNSVYMGLGMGASRLAEEGAAMFKTKALVNTLKATKVNGKLMTTDEIASMVKANPVKFPNEIVQSFKKLDNMAKALQVSSEVALDISSTYLANQAMGNGDLTNQDWIMSVGFALSGGVLQKQFASLNTEAKVKYLQDSFKDLRISNDDAHNILLTMDNISNGKIRNKKVKSTENKETIEAGGKSENTPVKENKSELPQKFKSTEKDFKELLESMYFTEEEIKKIDLKNEELHRALSFEMLLAKFDDAENVETMLKDPQTRRELIDDVTTSPDKLWQEESHKRISEYAYSEESINKTADYIKKCISDDIDLTKSDYDGVGLIAIILEDSTNIEKTFEYLSMISKFARNGSEKGDIWDIGYNIKKISGWSDSELELLTPERIDFITKINEKTEMSYRLGIEDILTLKNEKDLTPELMENYITNAKKLYGSHIAKADSKLNLADSVKKMQEVNDILEKYPMDFENTNPYEQITIDDVYTLTHRKNLPEIQKFVNSLTPYGKNQSIKSLCNNENFPIDSKVAEIFNFIKNPENKGLDVYTREHDKFEALLLELHSEGFEDWDSMKTLIDETRLYGGSFSYIDVKNKDYKGAAEAVKAIKDVGEYSNGLMYEIMKDENINFQSIADMCKYVKENNISTKGFDFYSICKNGGNIKSIELANYVKSRGITSDRLKEQDLNLAKTLLDIPGADDNLSLLNALFYTGGWVGREGIRKFTELKLEDPDFDKTKIFDWLKHVGTYRDIREWPMEHNKEWIIKNLRNPDIDDKVLLDIVNVLKDESIIPTQRDLADKLLKMPEFPHKDISNIVSVTTEQNLPIVTKLCEDKNFPKEHIASVAHFTNENTIQFITELCDIPHLNKKYIADILTYINGANKEFITTLCHDKEFPSNNISYIAQYTDAKNLDFIKSLYENKDFPKEDIVKMAASSNEHNINLLKNLLNNSEFTIQTIMDIGMNTNAKNVEIAESLSKIPDFPKDKIASYAYIFFHTKSDINPDFMAKKMNDFVQAKIDDSLITDIVSSANTLSVFNDDVINVLQRLKNENANTSQFVKMISDSEIPIKLNDKIEALLLLTNLKPDEKIIFSKQGIDIDNKINTLMKEINTKYPTISTSQADITTFLKHIANTDKADSVIQNADFAQFGKEGIKLAYSREEFMANMNALIQEYRKNDSTIDYSSVEIPELKLSENDITKTQEKIKELKSNHRTERAIIYLDKEAKSGTRIHDTQGGSNKAFYTEIDNKLYYIKYPTPEKLGQSVEEVIASQLYRAAGIDSPNMKYVYDKDGNIIGMAGEYVPEISMTPKNKKDRFDGFATDAWLANWDAPKNDNTQFRDNGVVKVDVGGSLHYRARGEMKDYGNIVNELSTLIEQNSQFSSMTKQELLDSLKHVTEMPEERIQKIIESSPSNDISLTETLLKRKEYLTIFEQKLTGIDESKFDNILDIVIEAKRQTNEEFKNDPDVAELLGYIPTKTGFEGLLNTQNLDNLNLSPQQRKIADKMKAEIERFTKNNKVADDVNLAPEAKDFINSILKGIPEFAAFFGKPQHSVHDYSLDIHILKVLQDSMNDPLYKELSDKDKIVLKFSTLLHDIGKQYLADGSDTGHAMKSAEYVYSILDKFNLDSETKDRIISTVENHHWFKEYNMHKMNAETVATLCRRPQDFLIYQIMAKADLKNVNDKMYLEKNNALTLENADANFDEKMQRIRPSVDKLAAKQVVITSSKFKEVPQRVTQDGRVLEAREFPRESKTLDGKTTEFKVLNLSNMDENTNMYKYGFNNIPLKDLRLTVHMVEQKIQLDTFKTLASNPMNNSAQSISMLSMADKSTYAGRAFGLIVDVNNANVAHAYYANTGSGTSKGLRHFVSEMFEETQHRTFVKDNFKNYFTEKGIELSEDDYAAIAKYIMDKKYPETQIKNLKIGDKTFKKEDILGAFTFSRDQLIEEKKQKTHGTHNEIVGLNSKVKGVVAKACSLDECPEWLLQFARDNNLPIILMGRSN